MDPGLAIQQSGTTTRNTRKTTGIAFSGGGIRSAAFCSGALRRMLQDNVPLEYLSCVSGGGFTGGAFMDWKYRHESNKWKNKKKWHNEFFERMQANAGYLCNWQNPILGICHSILIILVVLFVVYILPCTLWLPYALPVAAAVDFLFGEILRELYFFAWCTTGYLVFGTDDGPLQWLPNPCQSNAALYNYCDSFSCVLRAFKTRKSREIQRSLEITLDAEWIGIRFYCISTDCTRYSMAFKNLGQISHFLHFSRVSVLLPRHL